MGRFLLLVVGGIVLGGNLLSVTSLDRESRDLAVHHRVQETKLAREAADAAHAVVLGDVIDPATRRFRAALGRSTFDIADGEATVEAYTPSADGQTASFTILATYGGARHRVTSAYRINPTDWPGPLWLETPYVTASVDPGATVSAPGDRPDHGIYVDATRFDEYGLGSVLSTNDLSSDLSGALSPVTGLPIRVERGAGMDDVRSRFGTPTLAEIRARALSTFESGRDARFPGGRTVTGAETYGNYGDVFDPDPRIVHVSGPLVVESSGRLEGNGVLVVEGDLVVRGALRWEGLILVAAQDGHVVIDFDDGDVAVDGSVLLDQAAPPPGGHTDLTIFRDLDGSWAHPAGDGGRPGGKPPAPIFFTGPIAGQSYHYQHTHRIDQPEHLGNRRFVFDPDGNFQERYTRFEETVDDLIDLYGSGADVYLEFVNPEAHGAAEYTLTIDGDVTQGGVAAGFAGHPVGRPFRTELFRLGDLEELVVDVRSLRMLQRLKNRDRINSDNCVLSWNTSPFSPGCIVENRVAALSFLRDRDKALTIRLSVEGVGPVYEASLYWHTKSPGHPQEIAEQAADDLWREQIRNGSADYGAEVLLGSGVALDFDLDHVLTATNRLGLARLSVDHLSSFAEAVRSTAPLGGEELGGETPPVEP